MAGALPTSEIVALLGRRPSAQQAVLFRLPPKDHALEVFETLTSAEQAQLVARLRDDEVAAVFDAMDPDDRVGLLDELPAKVTGRLMRGPSPAERELTAVVLGYPDGSVGRRMSPEVVALRTDENAAAALGHVRDHLDDAETVYTLPVVQVIGLTLLSVCTLAAVAGGLIPRGARVLRADPAVFSNPFISTLLDATGLIIYFLIARAILGL